MNTLFIKKLGERQNLGGTLSAVLDCLAEIIAKNFADDVTIKIDDIVHTIALEFRQKLICKCCLAGTKQADDPNYHD